MKPEDLIASLVAKAKTTEMISQELADPRPPPPPPPYHPISRELADPRPPPPPPPYSPIPSVVAFTNDGQRKKVSSTLRVERRNTIQMSNPPTGNRKCGRRSSLPSSSGTNIMERTEKASSSPSSSQCSTPTARNRKQNQASRTPREIRNSPTSVTCRVESLLSMEEMSRLRRHLVATSSPLP